jgi:hypothetical protein
LLPGRVLASPADGNAQLAAWLGVANQRHRRVLGCAPADRVQADRAAMRPLPPVAPVTGWQAWLRWPGDHHRRLDSNDSSVHPAVVGRRVELRAGLERGWGWCEGRLVADHVRCWARQQTLSDPAHLQAAAQPRPPAGGAGASSQHAEEVQRRCLADDDAAVGLDDGQGWPAGRHQDRRSGPRRRARLPHWGAAGADPAPVGGPAGRTGPRRELDP